MSTEAKIAKKIYAIDDNCIFCRFAKWFVRREIKKEENLINYNEMPKLWI